jgi:methylase of polypeptide subunit release factors
MGKNNNAIIDPLIDNVGISLRNKMFDFILINPPYVVTSSEELKTSQMEPGF